MVGLYSSVRAAAMNVIDIAQKLLKLSALYETLVTVEEYCYSKLH